MDRDRAPFAESPVLIEARSGLVQRPGKVFCISAPMQLLKTFPLLKALKNKSFHTLQPGRRLVVIAFLPRRCQPPTKCPEQRENLR
jgi:hypothetical protein